MSHSFFLEDMPIQILTSVLPPTVAVKLFAASSYIGLRYIESRCSWHFIVTSHGRVVRRIHRWTVNSPHKGPITRKMFSFDDVIMRRTTSLVDVCHAISYYWSSVWRNHSVAGIRFSRRRLRQGYDGPSVWNMTKAPEVVITTTSGVAKDWAHLTLTERPSADTWHHWVSQQLLAFWHMLFIYFPFVVFSWYQTIIMHR